jgi:hypothetical protein
LRCSRYDRHLLCCAHDFTDLLTSYTERLGGRPPSDHTCDASSRTAREQGLVVRSLQHGMKLTPSNANIATVEDRKRERVLQKTSQRGFMVIAVDADDAHQIGDHTNRRLRAVDLGLYRKFVGRGRLRIDSVAGAPTQISRRFDRHLRVCQCVSDRLMLDDRMNAAAPFGPGEVQCEASSR